MDLWGILLAVAMVVGVFTVGVVIQILFDRRFGASARVPHADPSAQAHQQATRSQLGGFGPGGGPQP